MNDCLQINRYKFFIPKYSQKAINDGLIILHTDAKYVQQECEYLRDLNAYRGRRIVDFKMNKVELLMRIVVRIQQRPSRLEPFR